MDEGCDMQLWAYQLQLEEQEYEELMWHQNLLEIMELKNGD